MKTISVVLVVWLLMYSNCKAQWIQSNGPVGGIAYSLVTFSNNVFAGTNSGVFKSMDNAVSWRQTSLNNYSVKSLAVSARGGAPIIFAGTDTGGVFISTNLGSSWTQTSLTFHNISALTAAGDCIFAGSLANGLFRSTDNGSAWIQNPLGRNILSLASDGSYIYAGTDNGVYLSTDYGATWKQKGFMNYSMWSIAASGPYVYTSNVYTYRSTDYAESWTPIQQIPWESMRSIVINGPDVFVSAEGIYHSNDYGVNWVVAMFHDVRVLAAGGSNIFAGLSAAVDGSIGGVYTSTDNGGSWSQTPFNNQLVSSFLKTPEVIFAGTGNYGIFLSTDGGMDWKQSSFKEGYIFAMVQTGSALFAASNLGVHISNDGGHQWSPTNWNNNPVYSLAASGPKLFAGNYNGIYFTTDKGQSWSPSIITNQRVNSIVINDSNIFAGTDNYRIYHSTDNGVSWTSSEFYCQIINTLAVKGSTIFAGIGGNQFMPLYGVYISRDNGQTWQPSSLNDQIITSFAFNASLIFASTISNGIFLSTNDGLNWSRLNEGIGSQTVNSLLLTSDFIYAGTKGSSVWMRPLSEIIGMRNISGEVPKNFYLSQNFPNPFNPGTKIKFQIAKLGNAKLTIYDALGRDIATLVDEQLRPGTYEVEWDASNYPSGVYFYQLQVEPSARSERSDGYTETKKMMLLK